MFNIAQFTKFDPLPFIMAMAHQPCGVGNMPWKHALASRLPALARGGPKQALLCRFALNLIALHAQG
jgi:hypothetical protein